MIECQASKNQEFKVKRHEDKVSGAVIFQLSGPFTVRYMHNSIAPRTLRNIFASIPDGAEPAVHIFDLTQVPYMDSAGLRLIVDHCLRNRRKGIQVVATGVSPRVLERFKTSRMEDLLPMTASA